MLRLNNIPSRSPVFCWVATSPWWWHRQWIPPTRAAFINFFILKRGVYTSLCRSHTGMFRPVEQRVQADAGYTGAHGRSQQVFRSTESWKFPRQHPPRWATGCPEARGTKASCYTREEKVNFLHHLLLGNADIHKLLWLSDLVAKEAFVTLISNWRKIWLESRGFCLIWTFFYMHEIETQIHSTVFFLYL